MRFCFLVRLFIWLGHATPQLMVAGAAAGKSLGDCLADLQANVGCTLAAGVHQLNSTITLTDRNDDQSDRSLHWAVTRRRWPCPR